MGLSLQLFLFACFATVYVYAGSDGQEVIQPLVSYKSNCGNLYHNITFENERGCIGEYLYVSCSGMCGSNEIPKISHDR